MREKLGNPKNTIEVIQKYQFAFQKKFGQNFLIDPHVLDKIIGAAGVTKEDMVLEIGPGIGTMTQYLAEAAREVVAYMPLDRIVLETDCPYLSPVPNRGKRNSSLNLPYVVEEISRIKNVSVEQIIEITNRNAKQMYRLSL